MQGNPSILTALSRGNKVEVIVGDHTLTLTKDLNFDPNKHSWGAYTLTYWQGCFCEDERSAFVDIYGVLDYLRYLIPNSNILEQQMYLSLLKPLEYEVSMMIHEHWYEILDKFDANEAMFN